jgi:uncharacterized protein (TIGR03435 family)
MNAAHLAIMTLGLTVVLPAPPRAQAPAFESVTIVPNTSGDTARGMFRLMPNGGVKAVNITAFQLIQSAYQRHAFDRRQIEGGPAWLRTDRFDIEARASGGHEFGADSFPGQTWLKLRSMLEDRFKLRVRTDSRSAPVYELRPARATGETGPRLRKVDVDCAAEMRKKTKDEPEEGLQAGTPVCAVATYSGRLIADAVTMPALASLLSGTLDRPIVDRTGLSGNYAVELEAVEIKPHGPVGPSNRPSTTTQSLSAALPEQLGLKLEPVTGAIDVLVIDSAERPAGATPPK